MVTQKGMTRVLGLITSTETDKRHFMKTVYNLSCVLETVPGNKPPRNHTSSRSGTSNTMEETVASQTPASVVDNCTCVVVVPVVGGVAICCRGVIMC